MIVKKNIVVPNTLGVKSVAKQGCSAFSSGDVQLAIDAARAAGLSFVALGEGSNIVPLSEVDAFVCLIEIPGIRVCREDADSVSIAVGAGENWHGLVQRCLQRGWYGLENLSLIPGSVGAAPVQNIGAYGVEVASCIDGVTVLDEGGTIYLLDREACQFAYRDSIFKQRGGQTIVEVQLTLSKAPKVVWDYPDLQAELAAAQIDTPTPLDIAAAVITIRQRKLPDPAVTPNAGSFFKNPVVARHHASELRASYPELKQFLSSDPLRTEAVKLSAAQLIDMAGWKTKPAAKVACWQQQPLVLVNIDAASAQEILAFAEDIQRDVLGKFGVQLELEPSLLF